MAMESWEVYTTNVCRRDGDVLLRTNTLEDESAHKGSFAAKNKTYINNITTIYVRPGSNVEFHMCRT